MQLVTPVHRRVQRVYRLNWWDSMRRIYVPAAFPSIIVGLRYCFSLCMVGAVVAEMFAAHRGTGYLMIQAMQLHKVPLLFGLTLLLVIFALAINALFVAWEHHALHRRGVTDG
jgi:ABC-type nitrate/sulfonate/bicarbonate transport system permease component